MQPIIWGTAGHIDHGKTALIEALTGTNTDRLQEEQERGVTIDIGFAFLNDDISFIDVPGHEKFIKNMVTGVATIDAALLVIAADDGVMPQTREHLAILDLLGVSAGVIALTKSDIADPDWLELVEETIREWATNTGFENATIVRTSAETGQGIDELREEILDISGKVPRRLDRKIPRLPVDRVFTVKGFGTVVTGSVLSGDFRNGVSCDVLPGRKTVKVRGIQSHGHDVESVGMSERAALNLGGVETEDIQRGDQITNEGFLSATETLYVNAKLLPDTEHVLGQNQRVRIHLGTTEILGRCSILSANVIHPGETGFVKLRLEETAVVGYQDRFILRFYSPMETIGGGKVLYSSRFPNQNKKQVLEHLENLQSPEIREASLAFLQIAHPDFLSLDALSKAMFYGKDLLRNPVKKLVDEGLLAEFLLDGQTKYGTTSGIENLRDRAVEIVAAYQKNHPMEPGIKRSQLEQNLDIPGQTFQTIIRLLIEDGELVEEGPLLRTPDFEIRLSDSDANLKKDIEEKIRADGMQPPSLGDLAEHFSLEEKRLRQFLKILIYEKSIERLPDDLYFHKSAKANLKNHLQTFFAEDETLSVGEFKDIIGGSRKYAIPLLEYSDQQGWTMRDGEVRRKYNL
ncbi:MAG: selenocysteine-specific translation elongation factor [Candidatus Marinimicrobia bacterium]|nr:selenocysteine-specific translation elongation factor [Candidatus Neomarinimicrobiota bacterium]MCF7829604.1 selenocysteine-specific translation elongation factor [Candidatus Neomarinimicrobiota bacterium]MCF7879764.1 selenocysteine-specific translation elongation factor [Candidatus Neomarinimicrobiota bacterium]